MTFRDGLIYFIAVSYVVMWCLIGYKYYRHVTKKRRQEDGLQKFIDQISMESEQHEYTTGRFRGDR